MRASETRKNEKLLKNFAKRNHQITAFIAGMTVNEEAWLGIYRTIFNFWGICDLSFLR